MASFKENGVVFVKGLDTDPGFSYLRKSRGSEWYRTSWRWYPLLCKHLDVDEVWNAENLLRLRHKEARLISALKSRSVRCKDILERMFSFPLWKTQLHAASIMAAARRFYLGDDVGLGKTLSSFAAFVILKELGLAQKLLIVCTASVKHQWKYEIASALKDEYHGNYEMTIVDGSKTARTGLYKRETPIFITNYESLRSDWNSAGKRSPLRTSVDTVILDEAWKIKNFRTATARMIGDLVRDVPNVFALNGAPLGNGYEDIFGVMHVVDPTIYINWSNFKDRFMYQDPYNVYKYHYKRKDEIRDRAKPRLLRRTGGKDTPKITTSLYTIDLTREQRREYNKIVDERAGSLEVHNMARTACLFVKGLKPTDSPKYRELVRVLESLPTGTKCLAFSESKRFLTSVVETLKNSGIPTGLIVGGMGAKERFGTQGAFNDGNLQLLLCTAAGEAGLNLQSADIVINLDLPWNPDRLRQRVGRVRPHLGGSQRRITVINIFARDTVEERVIMKINEKLGHFHHFFNTEKKVDLTGVFAPRELDKLL